MEYVAAEHCLLDSLMLDSLMKIVHEDRTILYVAVNS